MRTRRFLLPLVVAAVAAGTAGGSAAKPEHEAVYGLVGSNVGTWLAQLDRDTLQPVGRGVRVGSGDEFAYDTNGWLAYSDGKRLRIVDPRVMRVFTTIPLWFGRPVALAWLKWDWIVAVTGTSLTEVRRIDWGRRKIVRTARVDGTVVARARGDDELVLLIAPQSEIGPAKLLVVDPRGRARLIDVPRIAVGSHFDESTSPPVGDVRMPALTLDAARDVAYVVGDGLVAEVPLAGSASYHALRGSFSKLVAGSYHSATLLSDGTLAVAGSASVDGRLMRPTGLELVDTTTWTSRLVDRGVSSVARWENLVLATGGTWSESETAEGMGLAAFDSSGAERFRLFSGQMVWLGGTTPTRAYVQVAERSSAAVELPSGRVAARLQRDLPFLLTMR